MNDRKEGPLRNYLLILLRAVIVFGTIVLLLAALYFAVRTALPFLIACILSLFLNPIVSFIAKKTGLSRGLASFLTLFILFSIAVSLLLIIAAALIRGIASFSKTVPGQLESLLGDLQTYFFSHLLPSWEKTVNIFSGLTKEQQHMLQVNFEGMAGTLINFLNDIAVRLLSSLTQFVSSLPDTLFSTVFVFLAAFFLSKDSEQIKKRLAMLPFFSPLRRPAKKMWQELKKTCAGFVRAQIILVSLTMILIYIGLLVLRTKYAFTIAFISALVDLIPYLGTGIIFIPWILYQYLTHHYFLTIALTVLYAVSVVQRQLIEPKILSSGIGLDPLVILIALYFGFRWLGFAGLVIGPLVLIMVRILHQVGAWRLLWNYIIGKKAS